MPAVRQWELYNIGFSPGTKLRVYTETLELSENYEGANISNAKQLVCRT